MEVFAFLQLAFCVFGFTASTVGQVVVFKSLGYVLGPYPYFILITISFAFVPILFFLLALIQASARAFEPEVTTCRFKRHFVVIGLCNALNGVMLMFANPFTPGLWQALAAPLTVPFTMLVSALILRTRFGLAQVLGAALVVGSVMAGPIVAGTGDMGIPSVFWLAVFILGQVPIAFCAVYQERAFAAAKLNVIYMLAWSNLSQFAFLLVFAPTAAVTPGFGGTTPAEFAQQFAEAVLCCRSPVPPCSGAARLLMLGVVTMVGGMAFQAAVVKHGGASLAMLLNTLNTPLCALAFCSRGLMGDYTESPPPGTWASVVGIVLGMLFYRLAPAEVEEQLPENSFDRRLLGSNDADSSSGNILPRPLKRSESLGEAKPPQVVGSRVGLIQSGYSADKCSETSLLYEFTVPGESMGCAIGQKRPRAFSQA